jgi:hypothetical protein
MGLIKTNAGRETMAEDKILLFRPYPMEAGQKIYIDGGPRGGDWEVVEVSREKVKLRCPITDKRVEWPRFCFFVEESKDIPWPHDED